MTTNDLSGYSEDDVREELISPLLRSLGYMRGGVNDIIREYPLRYGKSFLGRKKKNDPLLSGRADYVLKVGNRLCVVIEAKGASEPIDNIDGIEQAYSYAVHGEIRAVYFVLCNGHNLVIYQTNQGPEAPPIATFTLEQIRVNDPQIGNFLSPDWLAKDHSSKAPPIGPPIGAGLRSIARVSSGWIRFDDMICEYPVPTLDLMRKTQNTICSGSIQRDDHGVLTCVFEVRQGVRAFQEMADKLSLSGLECSSNDQSISSDIDRPTIFRGEKEVTLPAESAWENPVTGGVDVMQEDIVMSMTLTIQCALSDGVLTGHFTVDTHASWSRPFNMISKGRFQCDLV